MKQRDLNRLWGCSFEIRPSISLSQMNYRTLTERGYAYIVAIEKPMLQGYGRSRIVYIGKSKGLPAEAFSSGLMNALLSTGKFKHKKGLGRWNHRWIHFVPLETSWGIKADDLESALIHAFHVVYRVNPLLNTQKVHVTESALHPLRAAWKDSAGLLDSLVEIVKWFENPASEPGIAPQVATPSPASVQTPDVASTRDLEGGETAS